jgi:hypothetical protein
MIVEKGCSKTSCWRQHLGKRGRKYKNVRENSMTVSFTSNIISDKHTIDVMGKVCGIQGNEDKCTQVYGGKSFRKETSWMPQM